MKQNRVNRGKVGLLVLGCCGMITGAALAQPGVGGGGGGNPFLNLLQAAQGNQTPARANAPRVTVAADEYGNSLIVNATAEQMKLIKELVEKVDVPTDEPTIFKVFRLQHADPTEMANELAILFPDPSTTTGRGGGFGGGRGTTTPSGLMLKKAKVITVPDLRTSSLIVNASTNMMDQVEDVITKLDTNPANEIQSFTIPVNGDPAAMVQILQQLFPSRNGSRAGTSTLGNRNTSMQRTSTIGNTGTRTGSGIGGGARSGGTSFGGF